MIRPSAVSLFMVKILYVLIIVLLKALMNIKVVKHRDLLNQNVSVFFEKGFDQLGGSFNCDA